MGIPALHTLFPVDFINNKSITKPIMAETNMEIIPLGRALDRLWAVGKRVLYFFPQEAPDYLSEHKRGAEAMLIRLEDHPLPASPTVPDIAGRDIYVSPGSYYFKSDLGV